MPPQIDREFLFLRKSTLTALLLKSSDISKSQNFINLQMKTQELFSVKCPQAQEIFHTKQNLNRQNDLYKLGKSETDSAGIMF